MMYETFSASNEKEIKSWPAIFQHLNFYSFLFLLQKNSSSPLFKLSVTKIILPMSFINMCMYFY